MKRPDFKKLRKEVSSWITDAERCYDAEGLGVCDASDSLNIASRRINEFNNEMCNSRKVHIKV